MTVGEGLDPPETVPLMLCAFQMVALREATCQDDIPLFVRKKGLLQNKKLFDRIRRGDYQSPAGGQ